MDEQHAIYLIWIREHLIANKPIYKVGRTAQVAFNRFKSYPQGSRVLFYRACKDSIKTETNILSHFRKKYKKWEYEKEYFIGSHEEMIKDILRIIEIDDGILVSSSLPIIHKKQYDKNLNKMSQSLHLISKEKNEDPVIIHESDELISEIKPKKKNTKKMLKIEYIYSRKYKNTWVEYIDDRYIIYRSPKSSDNDINILEMQIKNGTCQLGKPKMEKKKDDDLYDDRPFTVSDYIPPSLSMDYRIQQQSLCSRIRDCFGNGLESYYSL
jgi:hypothetical protein